MLHLAPATDSALPLRGLPLLDIIYAQCLGVHRHEFRILRR